MRDVAAVAGVSLSTVSRVVNGSGAVAPEALRRVQDATALLGYRPDRRASALRRSDGRSGLIGLVVDDVANPFFSQLHRGVDEVLTAHGSVALVAGSGRDPRREDEILSAFSSHGVDGLIVAPAGPETGALERERRAGVPVVVVDRAPRDSTFDSVMADNAAGVTAAVEALTAAGHRRIAFLGGRRGITSTEQRLEGFRTALVAPGGYDDALVLTEVEEEGLPHRLDAMLAGQRAPSAIVSTQNVITEWTLRHLHARNLQHRVGVVGFDDVPLAELLDPPLSTVIADPAEIGREAARILLDRLDESGPQELQARVVATRLVLRGSERVGVPVE